MQIKGLPYIILYWALSLYEVYADTTFNITTSTESPTTTVPSSQSVTATNTVSTTETNNEVSDGKLQSREQTARRLLLRTMSAIDKALDFYMREVASINFDAIMGTRMLEGQLGNVIRHIENGDYPGVTSDIKARIQALISKSENVSDTAVPYIKARNLVNGYFEDLKPMILKGLWGNLDHPSRRTDPSFVTDNVHGNDDIYWTDCFIELLGNNQQCVKSQYCKDIMLATAYTGYPLTHQVIYVELGQAAGCFTEKELKEYDLLLQVFCSKILKEAKQIAKNGFHTGRDKDLFIEQHTVCGMAGFEDFFRSDWLIKILDWQWPEGCYGEDRGEKPDPVPPPQVRVKRDERVLVGGCLSHTTSVVLSALPQYVRYMMDFLFKKPRGTLGFFSG